MNAIFITGTDTGAGKTLVTGLLARYLRDRGYRAVTQKWAQSGNRRFSSDIAAHLKMMKRSRRDMRDFIPHLCPYVFKRASSPHLASALEKKKIDSGAIKKSFKFLAKRFDFVIVEGAGGALVPINKRMLIIDIARQLRLPVLIVAANRVGAINHTLLAIEAIKRRKMGLVGVLFNRRARNGDRIVLADNPRIIGALSGARILGGLPYSKNLDYLYKKFVPAGRKILTWMHG